MNAESKKSGLFGILFRFVEPFLYHKRRSFSFIDSMKSIPQIRINFLDGLHSLDGSSFTFEQSAIRDTELCETQVISKFNINKSLKEVRVDYFISNSITDIPSAIGEEANHSFLNYLDMCVEPFKHRFKYDDALKLYISKGLIESQNS